MKKKICVVFFTYKRAILLDYAIKALIKNAGHLINYPVNIIYHYDKLHHESYKHLEKKYKNKIKFYKRKKKSLFNHFYKFFRILNLFWLIRYPTMFKNFDNFKDILEKILAKKKSNLIMLCTDDTIFYRKVKITRENLDKIIVNKKKYFFRTNFGLGLKGIYRAKKNSFKFYKKNKKKLIVWNSKNKNLNFHMKYHFQVEGAIYHKKSLLNFLTPILYHNPVTLEAIGFREAKLRGFFENTISEINRSAVTYEINSVQKVTNLRFNYRLQLSPLLMMKAYLKNYVLHNLISPKEENFSKIIPKVVYVIKDKKKNTNIKNILSLNLK